MRSCCLYVVLVNLVLARAISARIYRHQRLFPSAHFLSPAQPCRTPFFPHTSRQDSLLLEAIAVLLSSHTAHTGPQFHSRAPMVRNSLTIRPFRPWDGLHDQNIREGHLCLPTAAALQIGVCESCRSSTAGRPASEEMRAAEVPTELLWCSFLRPAFGGGMRCVLGGISGWCEGRPRGRDPCRCDLLEGGLRRYFR